MREITDFSEVPPKYYLRLMRTRSGLYKEDFEHTKPATPEEMPSRFYILIPGKRGDNFNDFEEIFFRPITLATVNPVQQPKPLPLLEVDLIEEKRSNLLKLDVPLFHFIDEKGVEQFYETCFLNPVVNSRAIIDGVITEFEEKSGKVFAANVPDFLKTELGGSMIQKIVSNIKFEELSSKQKFIHFQRRRIEDNKVLLGLELENEKSDELARFDELIKAIRGYGIFPDSNGIEGKRQQLGLKDIGVVIQNLGATQNKHVIVSADFTVEKDSDDEEGYLLKYIHPISNRLTQQQLTIVIQVAREELISGWDKIYKREISRSIQANVYGLVFRSPNLIEGIENLEIVIKPIAIYS